MPEHVSRDELADSERESLDGSWKTANEILDALVEHTVRHRTSGCREWFCFDQDLADQMTSMTVPQQQVVLRAAMERLAVGPEIFTTQEAADHLGVSTGRVHQLAVSYPELAPVRKLPGPKGPLLFLGATWRRFKMRDRPAGRHAAAQRVDR